VSDSYERMSFDRALLISQRLEPIGENVFRYAEDLRAAGFGAFLPYEQFVTSFAGTADEVELHRRILVEQAKVMLTTRWPLILVEGQCKTGFRSPLIDDLTAKRDAENGVPERELEQRYGPAEAYLRRDIDPCRRRLAQQQVSDRTIYEARWADTVDAMSSLVAEETTSMATPLSKAHTFDRDGRYALFAAVMERDAAALGFNMTG
jgi:hypothetical protein